MDSEILLHQSLDSKTHRPAACISSVTFARFGVQYLKKTTMITECMCGSVPGVAEFLRINI